MDDEEQVDVEDFDSEYEDVSEPDTEPEKVERHPTGTNLVAELAKTKKGREALKRISEQVRDNFDVAWDASEPYRLRTAKDWDLFAGILPPKEAPFEGCANVHIPVALENTMRLALRAYDELFGDWTNVFGVVPVGPGDDELADVLTLHSNWQLREQIRDFPRQMHRAVLSFIWIGDVSGHSYFDPETRLNRHEVLTPDDIVVPYSSVTTMPDYSDVPWLAKILRLYDHEISAHADEWVDTDKLLANEPPCFSDEPDEPLAEHATKSSEQEIDDQQRAKPYKLIWYEGWVELPGEKRRRFCQIIAHPETGHLLCLKVHEQENWQDRVRYEHQMLELQAYESALEMRTQQVTQLETQSALIGEAERMGEGGPENNQAMMDGLGQMQAQIPMPEQPKWLGTRDDGMPEPPRMEPIHLFVHAVCIEPLKGNLGLSYGRMQADHNRAVNTMMSQFIDSATMSNVPCIVAGAGVSFSSEFELRPGKINVSSLPPEQLKNAFLPIQVPPPSAALMQTIEFVLAEASSSMQSPNVLSGEPGKSGEPYKGLAARIEQASKQLSTVTRKFLQEFLQPIVQNNALLNSQFLPDEELVEITNHALGRVVPYKITRKMYERSYAVLFRADLRFTSQTERVAEADEVLMMVGKLPPLQQNPAFVYAAIKKSLQARGLHDFVRLLGAPPPPPETFVPPAPPPAPPGPPGQPQPGAPGPNGAPRPPGPPQQGMPMPGMMQGGQA